jgi:hypothetical protein
MTRFALYALLQGFFQNTRRKRGPRHPSSGLWLLPWNVPPLPGARVKRRLECSPLHSGSRGHACAYCLQRAW